jgi:TonB family protein
MTWKSLFATLVVLLDAFVLATASASADTLDCNAAGLARLRPIISTHTLPPYPLEAIRSGQEGDTVLTVKIAPDGIPFATIVESSSGSAALDISAAKHVKGVWRWGRWDCSADRIAQVSIHWVLKSRFTIFIGLGLAIVVAIIIASVGAFFVFPSSVPFRYLGMPFNSASLSTTGTRIRRVGGFMMMLGGLFILISAVHMLIKLMLA